jgi:uncharacterized protein (UPF0335 family)
MTELNQTAGQLRSYVDRVERLADEKAQLTADIAEVYAEAKGNGYDVKALKAVVRKRKMDAQERAELESLEALYFAALETATE